MVHRYYGLRDNPFGATPDPGFLFGSGTHREALASILYGIESGLGFIALIAKPGMGKTTLLFETLSRVRETSKTVFLFQAISNGEQLFRALLDDLGLKESQGDMFEMQAKLNQILVSNSASGKRFILVIDEAQNLSEAVLESVRMLSNFETPNRKLIQVVLSGQPELGEKLASLQLLQLRQRVSIFASLQPLSCAEVSEYIRHRVEVSGCEAKSPIFTEAAVALIAKSSEGIPRNINNICFNALTLGCALRRKTIDMDVIREVISDLDLENHRGITKELVENPMSSARSIKEIWASFLPSRELRFPISAIAGVAIVVLFAWLGREDYRTLTAEGWFGTRVQAASVSGRNSAINTLDPMFGIQTQRLVIEGRGSLSQICVKNFGECSAKLLHEIIRLNPSVASPDQVLSGQTVYIPTIVLSTDHSH